MPRGLSMTLGLALLGGAALADVFTVTHAGDTGQGSLRWAIAAANTNTGPDTIEFDLPAGTVISPTTPLPTLTDEFTDICASVTRSGLPGVTVDGAALTRGTGLFVEGNYCLIRNLAIVRFPSWGIALSGTVACGIRHCHVGVNDEGTVRQSNGGADIALFNATMSVIGGSASSDGNLVGCGDTGTEAMGIRMDDSDANAIIGNAFGLQRDRKTSLGPGNGGIVMGVSGPCQGNRIGGTTPGDRNVLAGLDYGIVFTGPNNSGNRVLGNYFGMNAAGTAQRPLVLGVALGDNTGAQMIGGTSAGAANYFAPKSPKGAAGVVVAQGGKNTLVSGNRFGYLGNGSPAATMLAAIRLEDAPCVRVRDNRIQRAQKGVWLVGANSLAEVYGNRFSSCGRAVMVASQARCRLGNLGDASTRNDGGNTFAKSNSYTIYSATPNSNKAEGNSFGTQSVAAIDAKIYDKLDNPARGLVDYKPLKGGALPTGGVVALAALAAVPTSAGAQVTFSLSSAAQVRARVLNIAGRPLRTLCTGRPCEAGASTLLWNGQNDAGLQVPNGRYLVEVTARGEDGSQSRALTQARINH